MRSRCRSGRRHLVLGTTDHPALPRGLERPSSGWAASGGPSACSGRCPACTHRGRLRRWLHSQPDLPGGLRRPDRPRRGGARGLRPGRRSATRGWCAPSSRVMTRRRECARETTSAPSTAPPSTPRHPSRRRWPRRSRPASRSPCPRRATARSRRRSGHRWRFYYAEPSHQQYLEANPGGYCGLGGIGVSCPVGLSGTCISAAARPASGASAGCQRGVSAGRRACRAPPRPRPRSDARVRPPARVRRCAPTPCPAG